MTNADKIRQMSDEELAAFLLENVDCYSCTMHKPGCSIDCERSMLEWLKQEANNEQPCTHKCLACYYCEYFVCNLHCPAVQIILGAKMMDDYVKRSDAVEEIRGLVDTMSVCVSMDECNGMRSMKERALTALKRIPAADVRPVVCCKDCIHWKHNPGTNRMYCSVWDWINSSTGEDYCSFAEKRLEKMEGIEQIDLFPELSRFQKWKNKLTAKIIKILKRRR